jgi:hypothetical protein
MVKDTHVQVRLRQKYSDSRDAFHGIEQTPLREYQSVPWSVREIRMEGDSAA